jgi:hypothetical protein
MPIDLTKIKKKLNPPPDGQDVLRLKTGVVTAIGSNGTVTVTLNGATVTDVPVLSGAAVVSGLPVQILSYRGSLLAIGISGSAGPIASQSGATTNGTATPGNTSFFNSLTTTGVHGVAFTAPASGRVEVRGRAVGSNGTAAGFVLMDFEIREGSTPGSGAVVRAAGQATASVFQSSSAGQQATMMVGDLVTGLTPGVAYNATLAYASGAAGQTLTFNRRHILVRPS